MPLLTRATVPRVTRVGLTAAGAYTTAVIAGTTYYIIKNDGKTFFRLYKTGANACVVTFYTQAYMRGLALTAPTVSVPATTGDVLVGPFEPTVFNDANGDMQFSFSEVTAMFFLPFTTA